MINRLKLRHYVLLTGGWTALGAGLLILPIPVPLPVPVAGILVVTGTAILSVHSRRFRHGIQYARYRYGWLSRTVDVIAVRAPNNVKRMVHRTRPDLVARYARRRAGRAGI